MSRCSMRDTLLRALLLLGIALSLITIQPAMSQSESSQATIAALQTQIADAEATIESMTEGLTPEAIATEPSINTSGSSLTRTVTLESGSQLETAAWSVAVLQMQEQQSIETYEVFTAQGKYLLVTLQIDNLTNLPLEFPYEDLSAVDDQGRSFGYQDTLSANLINDLYNPLFVYSLLQPSLSYETVVVFEVSTESASPQLELNDESGDRASEARAAADDARQQAQPLGSTFEISGWEVRVDSTETFDSYTSVWGTHAPRGEYLAIFATVTNLGTSQASFPYEEIRLVDDEGRWFSFNLSPTDGLSLELTELQYWEQLQPGIEYQIGIMFDVPLESDNLVLVESFANPKVSVEIE